jgi:CubicO group peptidase (beta-lactamase class C family)
VENAPGFRYNIGSITKVFTRVIITQLAGEGRLETSDTIATHLPDYPDEEIAAKVTIDHLLDMSSGLGDIFGERYDATPKDEITELPDYLKLFAGQPLQFEPGSSRAYSNAGYIVLGLIIEKLTGMPYPKALAERVFAPAGMSGSAALPRDDLPDDAAFGYTRAGWMAAMEGDNPPTGEWTINTDSLPGRGSSAGGTYSTARDLLAFDRALHNGTLCDPAYWKKYGGLGFAGGANGINAVLESDWDKGWTIVVMANLDPPSAMRVAGELRETIKGSAE